MENYIIIIVLVCIIAAAVIYVVRAKKSGEKCIGCPNSKQCGGSCGGGCGSQNAKKD